MSFDYYKLPHPGIQSLCPYIPGKSIEEVAREEGLTNIIKLASNENPLGCSPRVKEALEHLSRFKIATYPSPMNHRLRHLLSEFLHVTDEHVILGNGSDLLFTLLLITFALHTGRSMLTHEYAFSVYEIQAKALGIPVVKIGNLANFEVDIDGLIEASRKNIGLIFLANPNNPTGCFIQPTEIKRLLDNIPPQTLLVLDEAYYEYAYQKGDVTTLNFLKTYSNLIITRTFSKAYGLAGLRIGYGIADPKIIQLLARVQLSFLVNQAALEAAAAAFDDQAFVQQTIQVNQEGMQQMEQGLKKLTLAFRLSHANFIILNCQQDAALFYKKFLKLGIIVRPLHGFGLNNYLRVTIGTLEQNIRFLDGLTTILNNNEELPCKLI